MRVFHDNFVVTIDLFIKPVSASVQLVHDTVQSGKNWKVKVVKTRLCPLYYYIFSMVITREMLWDPISLQYKKKITSHGIWIYLLIVVSMSSRDFEWGVSENNNNKEKHDFNAKQAEHLVGLAL